MLKLKLHYFGSLMQRAKSLEKTLLPDFFVLGDKDILAYMELFSHCV